MLHSAGKPPPPSAFVDHFIESDSHTFTVLLDADSIVDEIKLRRAAASGIPPHQRPHVWKLLLGIASFEKADDVALELDRIHDYHALTVNIDFEADIPRLIRRVLKRSRTVYQPMPTHAKKIGRHGSSSGDSYDGDDDDDRSSDTPTATSPLLSTNGRAINYARHSKPPNMRIIDREVQAKFTRIICTYLQNASDDVEFDPDMVHLCAPFVEIMSTEADAFHAFNALMQRHQHMYTEHGLREAVSEFSAMFRSLHPSLYDMFVLEEVDIKSFVRKWMRGLLVHQLPRRSVLRLWDSYFANLANTGLGLHPFVCLVFIEHIKPELEDCEDSERMTSLVSKLPAMDIDHVIAHALTVRDQLREHGIVA